MNIDLTDAERTHLLILVQNETIELERALEHMPRTSHHYTRVTAELAQLNAIHDKLEPPCLTPIA